LGSAAIWEKPEQPEKLSGLQGPSAPFFARLTYQRTAQRDVRRQPGTSFRDDAIWHGRNRWNSDPFDHWAAPQFGKSPNSLKSCPGSKGLRPLFLPG